MQELLIVLVGTGVLFIALGVAVIALVVIIWG